MNEASNLKIKEQQPVFYTFESWKSSLIMLAFKTYKPTTWGVGEHDSQSVGRSLPAELSTHTKGKLSVLYEFTAAVWVWVGGKCSKLIIL